MGRILAVTQRELAGYFATPLAYVFIVIFLGLAGAATMFLGNFIDRGRADLVAFFQFHPWLYLFLVPAISMRLWAEERRAGTIEMLLTLPVSTGVAVTGKFLAAWIFCGVALALTFPLWLTVDRLGEPDHGVIAASYIGSWLMAGAYLAIGSVISALTKNQVIAFVLAAALCFVLTVAGSPFVLGFLTGWAPQIVVETVAAFSFLTRFTAITRGVIDFADAFFFLSIIVAALYLTCVAVELKKAE